ncbi:hypothetical protein ACIBBB_17340 [Streptomyces sp. NPDC051217]|uniref:hypothetical protein n=1 Tax=Streptomyces sp. NPDC051217 TaxID=3365644 RepID=UPI0037A5F1BC
MKTQLDGRPRSICLQGNRLVLHLVFRELDLQRIEDPEYDWSSELKHVPGLTEQSLTSLTRSINDSYSTNYLTSLFKNITKCRDLVQKVRSGNEESNKGVDGQ